MLSNYIFDAAQYSWTWENYFEMFDVMLQMSELCFGSGGLQACMCKAVCLQTQREWCFE